ncbi:2-hydroxyacid dehydrogenase [Mesobacillus maritimus]|uniref:D-glycerate dehydrogenase n=1 Tax=Mesobacillus maritimus TaxID=1643336 RepID=A0ABS7K6K7_9BACI|nr:D-glycerate dehydrogenase [Mesobacillus maritimus]MBY0097892.1 D-glycerate dehydrogenase [Mesobacillus maritimus]
MKPKVLVYSKVDPKVLDFVKQTCEVVYFEGLEEETFPTFLHELKDAHGILGAGLKVDDDLLKNAPQLKVVSNISVGYENLHLPAISARGVMATNTPGVLNDTVADLIMGLMLSTARRLPELDQFVKTGQWDSNLGEQYFGLDIHQKVLGIIGMGGIGSAVAKRAHHGFDMEILYHNRSRKPDAEEKYAASYCTMEELLQNSDFVLLMTPLTPETEKLMGEKEFSLMKKSAIFINSSRGKTVDEEALIQALQTGEIYGAGLDVFVNEPVEVDNPLLSMKNVVTLPHIGSATYETRYKMAMSAATNLVAGLKGETPTNLLNKPVNI